ncbi:hypothetical protein PHYPO_G00046300 [Pangasianodon hypophthalmus]|uniref:HAT C-terminal dimerisation domain-containing protein n=1 Tax=Pangasianodon hypophthalmus TaxID=310915 RepID=A0A5N5MI59_PANHP|nr:uncharacterized protein LOC117595691 [Pangasianodon hypophthalmus]KAB5554101.1 hypothetical protein PHYPO_G00046300 [Pangasianodon hypophthalmus]
MTEYCSDVVSVTDDDDPSKHIIAAALDPRFRKLKFLTPQEKFSVQSKLQDLALQIAFEKNQPSTGESTPSDDLHSTSGHESTLDSLLGCDSDGDESETDQQASHEQLVSNEVLMYFAEPPILKKQCPLSWWKLNETKYPTMAILAKSFLCIPATSTASEWLFSVAGYIVSKKRASLDPDHVDMLTFMHCNKP